MFHSIFREFHISNFYESREISICHNSQPAFTCSKLTIETLEQGVKYVQS